MDITVGIIIRKIIGAACFGGGFYLTYYFDSVMVSFVSTIFSVLLICLGLYLLFTESFYPKRTDRM